MIPLLNKIRIFNSYKDLSFGKNWVSIFDYQITNNDKNTFDRDDQSFDMDLFKKMTDSDTTLELERVRTRIKYTQHIFNIAIKDNINERFVHNFKQLIMSIYNEDFWYLKNFEPKFKANNDEGNKAMLVLLYETCRR